MLDAHQDVCRLCDDDSRLWRIKKFTDINRSTQSMATIFFFKQNRSHKKKQHIPIVTFYMARVLIHSLLSFRRVKYWSSNHDTIGICINCILFDSRIKFAIFVCCIKHFFVDVINQSTCYRHHGVVVVANFHLKESCHFFSARVHIHSKWVEIILTKTKTKNEWKVKITWEKSVQNIFIYIDFFLFRQ